MRRIVAPAVLVFFFVLWAVSAGSSLVSEKPLLSFDFEEKGGNIVKDASGNGLDGMISGEAVQVKERFGLALRLSGLTNYITVDDNPLLRAPKGVTWEIWAKPETQGRWQALITKMGIDGIETRLQIDPKNRLAWEGLIIGEKGVALYTEEGIIQIGEWNHIVATFDGSCISIYANGVKRATEGAQGDFKWSKANLIIGAAWYGANGFKGLIDRVRLYNYGLSAEEIQKAWKGEVRQEVPEDLKK